MNRGMVGVLCGFQRVGVGVISGYQDLAFMVFLNAGWASHKLSRGIEFVTWYKGHTTETTFVSDSRYRWDGETNENLPAKA